MKHTGGHRSGNYVTCPMTSRGLQNMLKTYVEDVIRVLMIIYSLGTKLFVLEVESLKLIKLPVVFFSIFGKQKDKRNKAEQLFSLEMNIMVALVPKHRVYVQLVDI
jgi:hypothetical protein